MRDCSISILFTIVLLSLLSVATAVGDTSEHHWFSPTCASNGLNDLTISSTIAVFAAGILAASIVSSGYGWQFLASTNVGQYGQKKRYHDHGSRLFTRHIRSLHYFWIGTVRLSTRTIRSCHVPLCFGCCPIDLGPNAARGCQKAAIWRSFALPRRLD